MGLLSNLKKVGKDMFDTVADFTSDVFEVVTDVGKTGVDLAKDSVNVLGSLFTPASTKTAVDKMHDNLTDNATELLKDATAGGLNLLNNSVQTLESTSQLIVNSADSIYKPGEDNFQEIDKVLKKVEDITNAGDALYDNKEPVMDLFGTVLTTIGKGINLDVIKSAWDKSKEQDNIEDTLKTFFNFFDNLYIGCGQEIFNDLSDVSGGKLVNDKDLTDVKPTNNLTNKDLLILSTIEYTDIATIDNKGKQLGDVINEIKDSVGRDKDKDFTTDDIEKLRAQGFTIGGESTDQEICDIFNEISNSEKLSNLTILDNTDQEQNYITATTYGTLKNGQLEGSATVVFRGTDSATAWADDFEGLTDADTIMQQAANDYIYNQANGIYQISDMTITGQSKGGNLAMYAAVLNEELVSNCVSFSGQGFNKDFLEKYKDEIKKVSPRITSISSYVDPFNATLTNIAGTIVTVDTKISEESRNINNIFEFAKEAHTAGAMYEANKNGWIVKEKSPLSELIGKICSSVEELKPPVKDWIVKMASEWADENLAKDSEIGDKDQEEFGEEIKLDYGLYLKATKDGYNVYSEDMSETSTVATLDINGNITSGNFDAIANANNVSVNDILKEISNTLSLKKDNNIKSKDNDMKLLNYFLNKNEKNIDF